MLRILGSNPEMLANCAMPSSERRSAGLFRIADQSPRTSKASLGGLVGAELERQMFLSQDPEEVRRIERYARRKSTAAASPSVENPLHGFNDEWRGEGIDVASLRDRPADLASVPDNNVDQKGLRRSSFFVGGDRWRGGGIAKIAKRLVVEVTAKACHSQVAGDDRNF
jgi:hypothetical protein